MTDVEADEDLLKLDPNVALRLGLTKGTAIFTPATQETEDDEDIEAVLLEEERNDPIKNLLNAS